MTARNETHDIQKQDGDLRAYKMLDVKIFKGAAVFIDGDGYAYSNDGTTNTLTNGERFVGIACDTQDNSAGASGDLDIQVIASGVVRLPVSDSIAQTNVGDPVFVNDVTDDATTTITSSTGNPQATIGHIVEVISADFARVALNTYVAVANGA